MNPPPEHGSAKRWRVLLAKGAPKLLRDFAYLAGGQLVGKVIALLVFAKLARTLDPEGYGAVEYVVGMAGFFAIAIGCGLGTIAVRKAAESREDLPRLAAEIPIVRLVIAAIAIPLMIGGVEAFGPAALPRTLVWLFAASLVFAAWNQEWALQSAELMAAVSFAQTLRVLVFAALVLLLVHGPGDVASVGWAELAAAVAVTVYYLAVQHYRITPVRISFSLQRMTRLVREGVAVGLSQFVWSAAQFAPLFLVGSIVGGADAGWYAAAQRLVTSIVAFSFIYHFNLYPALARAAVAGTAVLAELLRISFRVTGWLSIALALGLALGATPILTTIFGGRFAVAAPALAILLWVIPITFLSGHARYSLIVAGAQTRVLFAQVAGLVTIALAGIPLVMAFGDVGAAIAGVAGSAAVWVTSHVLAVRMQTPSPQLLLVLRPSLLALAIGVAAEFAPMGPLAKAAAGVVLYSLLAPLLDRFLLPDFIKLAHAKATIAPSQPT
jgi:O-antigen/teichoic acid export membrane protein